MTTDLLVHVGRDIRYLRGSPWEIDIERLGVPKKVLTGDPMLTHVIWCAQRPLLASRVTHTSQLLIVCMGSFGALEQLLQQQFVPETQTCVRAVVLRLHY